MIVAAIALVAFLAGIVIGWLLCLLAAVMGLRRAGWLEW